MEENMDTMLATMTEPAKFVGVLHFIGCIIPWPWESRRPRLPCALDVPT